MSMSTRIEDLPGSIPDDIRNDIHDIAIRHQEEEEVVRSNPSGKPTPSSEIVISPSLL